MGTLYVDATAADDTANGSTPALAKKTVRGAQNAASSGDKILIKTGLCYDPLSGVHMFFTGVSNIEIGTYGTDSDKPILDAMTYEAPNASGWTYLGSGVWKKVFGAWYIRRLFVGSINNGLLVSQRTLGTAMRRAYGPGLTGTSANPSEATIIAGLSSSMIWFGGGSTTSYALYVYTGTANRTPPNYYGGLAFIQNDGTGVGKYGAASGIHVQNQTGIFAHDLQMRGHGAASIRLQAQNSDARDVKDCLFEDIIMMAPYQGAFNAQIAGETSPTHRVTATTVRRCQLYYWSSENETELNQSYDNLSGVSDGFAARDGAIAITIQECLSVDSMHQGMVCGSTAMRTTPPSKCLFLDNEIRFSPWSAYGRGFSVYDGDPEFRRNIIDGQNTRIQLAGSCTVQSNIWINMRDSVRKQDVAEWLACESNMVDSFVTGIGNERYLRIQPIAVKVYNNVVYSPVDTAISFNYYDKTSLGEGDNSFGQNTIQIYNNIIFQPQNGFVRTYNDSAKTINTQLFKNNCVYNGAILDNKVTWIGTPYTVASAPGFSGHREDHPQLSSFHVPQNQALAGAGVAVSGKDFRKRPFLASPSIGAIEIKAVTPRAIFTKP